jgi:hypothetical protein
VTTQATQMTSASSSLVKIRTLVNWAEDGAQFGSNGGSYDHQLALEIIRTVEDDL